MTRAQSTIVINGKVYDVVTGLPVAQPETASHNTAIKNTPVLAPEIVQQVVSVRAVRAAKAMHRLTQRSQTLRRDILKQPTRAQQQLQTRKYQTGHVAQSGMITKFAPHPKPLHPATTSNATQQSVPETATVVSPHPVVTAAKKRTQDKASKSPTLQPAALSSRELKQQLITERLALAQPSRADAQYRPPRKPWLSRAPRVSSIIVASLAIVFLGGYLTYISMPNLSMRVAASKAGVNATYPDYKPDGYRFDGPIAYNNGEVSVHFASNSNTQGYTVAQQNSSWDSQAVLDNYVTKKSNQYLTYSKQGLTIYTYNNNAAWVNGGVLYTIEGNAPLSNQQILRIAASM